MLLQTDGIDFGRMSLAGKAKWLRAAMSQKSSSRMSLEEIQSFLSALSDKEAEEVVSQGNNNGKTPIHFASQSFIGNQEGASLVEMLIARRASVNQTTRRGHTPLIFAAGRAHNDIVRVLLDHGADPRAFPTSEKLQAHTMRCCL